MSGKEKLEPWASSKWLSKSAAAKYIHRHVDAVQELIESGEIPAVYGAFSRGGSRTIYINIDDLDAYMRRTLSLRSPAMRCRTRSTPLCSPCKRACLSAWPATDVRGPHDGSRIVPEDCSI